MNINITTKFDIGDIVKVISTNKFYKIIRYVWIMDSNKKIECGYVLEDLSKEERINRHSWNEDELKKVIE